MAVAVFPTAVGPTTTTKNFKYQSYLFTEYGESAIIAKPHYCKPNHKLTKRILIVDDNAVNRKYARAVLKADHLDITEAEDGEEALECIALQHFDLVLMDIQMPGMDGFECLQKIRQDFPNVSCPVLAITAFSNERERSEFTTAGFQTLIPKPIRASELKSEVDKWLGIGETTDFNKKPDNTDTGEIIDFSVYEDLKRHIRSDSIIDIYEEFESETSGFVEQLNFLVPAKNYPEILSILHTIKGNAGSLGIFILADHTRQMEEKLRKTRYGDLDHDFDLLKEQFSNFVENYRRILN